MAATIAGTEVRAQLEKWLADFWTPNSMRGSYLGVAPSDVKENAALAAAWSALAQGEHGVALTNLFAEHVDRILGPLERRHILAGRLIDIIEANNDGALTELEQAADRIDAGHA